MGAVVKLVREAPEPWTLDRYATEINTHFRKAAAGERTSGINRLNAGRALIEARDMVPAGQWEAWCNKNLEPSMRDIRKAMRMAGDPEPERALDRERAATRERMRALRAGRTCARSIEIDQQSADPVAIAVYAYQGFSVEQRIPTGSRPNRQRGTGMIPCP
jgi:hypothetical protein